MKITNLTALLSSLVALSAPLLAHDFWLEPATWRPATDARVALALRVGEQFGGDEVARRAERIVRFDLLRGDSQTPVPGLEDQTPAGWLRVKEPGLVRVVYQQKPVAIELEAAKFEGYLREEGLEHVARLRAERGQSTARAKELYTRCPKALLVVGDGPHEGFDAAAGLTLELVPRVDPTRLKPGEKLELELLYQGQPLVNALVGCRTRLKPEEEVRLRTDEKGRVTFTLPAAGPTLVRVVHMVEAAQDSGAEWHSFWASLTFDVLRAPKSD